MLGTLRADLAAPVRALRRSASASAAAALPLRALHTRSSHAASVGSTGATVASGAAAPALRVGILGAGISGLTLAHQLQRKFREQGRHNVEIHMHERSGRSGGWVRTQASDGFLLERGPRSMMFRRDDPASAATLDVVTQLGLGSQVVVADMAAAKRFAWNGGQGGKMIAMPTGLGSLIRFPYRNQLIKGFVHEWREPPMPADATEEQLDESVLAWATRRFNSTIAAEVIDPMMAGIYAGDTAKLSMQSCMPRLPKMERRSGSILRDQIAPPEHVKAARLAKLKAARPEAEAEDTNQMMQRDAFQWRREVEKKGIFSFNGGLGTFIRALRMRLADGSNDPYSAVLARHTTAPDAEFVMHSNTNVQGVSIDAENKPVLRVCDAKDGANAQNWQYDHVFSTLPSHELHALLSHPSSALPLSSEHSAQVAALLSPSSMPVASMWTVSVVYRGQVLRPDQHAFGLLVPSRHNIPGLELLGIAFDSCMFPTHGSGAEGGETRLTVMLGGDRHPWLVDASESDIALHGLRAIEAMLGVDHQTHRPVLVQAALNRNCIPQFYVGHAAKQHTLHQLLQHIAYTPSSFQLPVANPLPPIHVPMHESGARAAEGGAKSLLPLTLLGTNYGVSLNDCIHHASQSAADFVFRSMQQRQ